MQKTVAVNERGLRIGEDHPNAKLTDAEVERIRSLHEDGMSYDALAEKFEVSKWAIGRICRYERRAQTPANFKNVHVLDCEYAGMDAMKLTPEKLTAFCAALAETCNVGRACRAVGISRQTAYNWREADADFALAWERAMKAGLLALEDEAHRRAFEGTDEPVFYKGDECGSVRKYSDTLAIFLLKAHAPEKYREKTSMELTGANGGGWEQEVFE